MADVELNLESSSPDELTGLGIRAYAIGDFSNAAAAFAKASQILAELHGDEHDSLGEVLVHYARSLLEVSREEGEPFGDAIPRGDDTSSDSDEEDKDDVEKTEEKKEDPQKEDTEKEDTSDNKKEEINNVENKESKTNGEPSTNGEPGGSEEKEEPASDLQIAWEVLEVAKKIFTKRGAAGRELLAETHILLGEVAMESENFQEGIQDIATGIEIQKEVYEPTSRKLAGSYYKLGIVHSTVSNIDEAIESFLKSIDILKKRIALLKETKDEKTENKINEEIEDLEKLIPEIEEKIVDTKSIKEEMASKLIQEMSSEQKTPPKDEGSSSKANDISHLVKRKRKPDDEPTQSDQPTKRPTP